MPKTASIHVEVNGVLPSTSKQYLRGIVMRTSKLTGALCAAGALFLAGCETTTSIPTVTRLPGPAAIVNHDRDLQNAGIGYRVAFDPNRSALAPVDMAVLDEAALWLQAGSDRCIVVDAHLPAGADKTARRLARSRIQAVVSYVAAKHVPQTRVQQGALREVLADDTVLLRKDPTCPDGENGNGWSAAFSGGDTLVSAGPAGDLATSSRDALPREPGVAPQGGSSPSGNAVTEVSASTSPAGGSSDGGGSGTSAGTGGSGSTTPASGGSGEPQESGPTGQEPGAPQGGGTDQPTGSGPQEQNGSPGNSSNTPSADRTDAGRGNGSEDGDPGRSGQHNQGGDE
jgi:hypothetical protein